MRWTRVRALSHSALHGHCPSETLLTVSVCRVEQLKEHRLGSEQGEPHKEAIVPQGQNAISEDAGRKTALTGHLSFWHMKSDAASEWCIFSSLFFMKNVAFFNIISLRSSSSSQTRVVNLFSSSVHILSLINKVATVQISRLYLMSTSTPGLSSILRLCFETDGYYYNKKVANYFSSRRQKQLTTGIMCWLKSIPVSVKGERKSNFPLSQLAYIHCSQYPDLDPATAVVH